MELNQNYPYIYKN